MKSYNVWVEIEEYDDETDEYTTLDAPGSKIGTFAEYDKAARLVDKLNEVGLCIAKSLLTQPARAALKGAKA